MPLLQRDLCACTHRCHLFCRYVGSESDERRHNRPCSRKRRRLASVFPWHRESNVSIGTGVLPRDQEALQQTPLATPAAAPQVQRQHGQNERLSRPASEDPEQASPTLAGPSPLAQPRRPPYMLSLPPVARPPVMIAQAPRPCIHAGGSRGRGGAAHPHGAAVRAGAGPGAAHIQRVPDLVGMAAAPIVCQQGR